MTAFQFGYQPAELVVHLDEDSDFIQTLSATDDFPDGTTVALVLEPFGEGDTVTWDAMIDLPTISWHVAKTDVAALGPGSGYGASVIYSDGAGTNLLWMRGRVEWDG